MAYDKFQRVASITDALDNYTELLKDAGGFVTSTRNKRGNITTYTYDSQYPFG